MGYFLILCYSCLVLSLWLYGLNCYLMIFLHLKGRKSHDLLCKEIAEQSFHPKQYPVVTTQIAVYNEYNVIERIIAACIEIDYRGVVQVTGTAVQAEIQPAGRTRIDVKKGCRADNVTKSGIDASGISDVLGSADGAIVHGGAGGGVDDGDELRVGLNGQQQKRNTETRYCNPSHRDLPKHIRRNWCAVSCQSFYPAVSPPLMAIGGFFYDEMPGLAATPGPAGPSPGWRRPKSDPFQSE